jgi:hypothetical protein
MPSMVRISAVDVAAYHAVDAAPARLVGHRALVVGDELHRVLDLVLEVGRQRPVAGCACGGPN